MALNECVSAGGAKNPTINESDLTYYGASLDSGEPCVASEWSLTALWDASSGEDVVLDRWDAFKQDVEAKDDAGNSAVAIGDPLYYHASDGKINKKVNGGVFYGWAMGEVTSGSTAEICIWCGEDPDYTSFLDAQELKFGDDADVIFVFDGTTMQVLPAADDTVLEIGDADATQLSFDIKLYGEAANGADYVFWDASASRLYSVGDAYISGRDDDANGIGIAAGTKSTAGAPGTTGTQAGSMVFNTNDSKLYIFNGSAWVSVALS